jgi:hypothetical protein
MTLPAEVTPTATTNGAVATGVVIASGTFARGDFAVGGKQLRRQKQTDIRIIAGGLSVFV